MALGYIGWKSSGCCVERRSVSGTKSPYDRRRTNELAKTVVLVAIEWLDGAGGQRRGDRRDRLGRYNARCDQAADG